MVAKALVVTGDLCEFEGDQARARDLYQRALESYRSMGNERGEAWALQGLGRAEWGLVDPAALRARFQRAFEIFQARGDVAGLAFTRQYLASWESAWGSPTRAVELVRDNLALVLPTGIPQLVAFVHELAALADFMAGDGRRAAGELATALETFQGLGDVPDSLHCLQNIAAWASGSQPEPAARLLAAVGTLRADRGLPDRPYQDPLGDETRRRLLAALGPAGFAEQSQLGAALDLDAAVRLAEDLLGNT